MVETNTDRSECALKAFAHFIIAVTCVAILTAPTFGRLYITEFMADNDSGLTDTDGDTPDWIEIHNAGTTAVNLDGYFLTDDEDLDELWRLPAVTLGAGEFLVVFASNKDRSDPAGELHTDFKLDSDGEYLGLIRPDGQTVEFDFGDEYPRQIGDISYGLAFDENAVAFLTLVPEYADARVLAPAEDLGQAWTAPGFADSAWLAGSAAIGYETNPDADTSYEGLFHTDLQSVLYNQAGGAYVRTTFEVNDPAAMTSLTLRMRADDGFVAYINGVEVCRMHAPDPIAYDSVASGSRTDSIALAVAEFDISDSIGVLSTGENVLAIHALNRTVSSSDFLNSPQLVAETGVGLLEQQAYFTTPTPGAENVAGTLGVVADTRFSVDRGFYTSDFDVEITTDTAGAEIRYTTDGSTPTATYGQVYASPVSITGQTVLRAAAFKPGYHPSNVDTQTYIFLDDVLTQTDNPAGYPSTWPGDSFTRPADYGMDPEVVDDPRYADMMEAALTSIPTISIVTDRENLFDTSIGIYVKATRSGIEYEVPASVEYFDAEGNEEFQIDCGLRMRGGASRNQRTTPKHSFRLIFRNMYGAGKLNYPLFGPDATDSFDTIVLRAGSNLSWGHHNGWPVYSENRKYAQYIRDQWAKDVQIAMGHDGCHNSYAHLYINGIYWGLYNPGERPSAPFAASYEGGEKEDYDVINSGEAIDGNTTAWNQLLSLSNSGLSGAAAYEQIKQMLDLEAFADYMIINQYGGNFDWDHHNWHAWRNRNGGKWRIAVWDYEIALVRLNDNRIDPAKFGQFEPSSAYTSTMVLTKLWTQLLANDEFKILFADRVHKHLFGEGLLTPARAMEMWNARSDQIYDAILGESARWGDYRRDVYYAGRSEFNDRQLYDRDGEWLTERTRLMNSYFPMRTDTVIQQYRNYGAYPSIDAPRFMLNGYESYGGFFPTDATLTLTATADAIVYTVDGSDPRLVGGGVNSSAVIIAPSAAVTLTHDTIIKARSFENGQWSALTEATFRMATPPTLAITEINYNPAQPTEAELAAGYADNDAFEFIELQNVGDEMVDLRTVEFVDGVTFDFSQSPITTLPPGGFVLVVADEAAFTLRYGSSLPVAGAFTGSLNNGGETIVIHRAGTEFIHLTYDDSGAWPGRADGKGATLEAIDPTGDVNDGNNWRSSAEHLGSPGYTGCYLVGEIVINEVLAHTDGEPTDSIELHNVTDIAIDISGWVLSDTYVTFDKYRIPNGTLIPAGGYLVFDEHDFNPTGLTVDASDDIETDFALSGAYGDEVWLMATNENGEIIRYVDHVDFPASHNGESFGRCPDGVGRLTPMTSVTLRAANAAPRVGPVIISEVMYDGRGLPGATPTMTMEATFDEDGDGFVYEDDVFGTDGDNYVSGMAASGAVSVSLSYGPIAPVSGGWTTSIDLAEPNNVTLSLQFDLLATGGFETYEYIDVIAAIDGDPVGDGPDGAVYRYVGDGPDTKVDTTDWVDVELTFPLDAGTHVLTLGLYCNSNVAGDFASVRFDNVQVYTAPDAGDLEFVEIYNPTAVAIDLTGWRMRKGADFDFADDTIVSAGERLVILSFNPDKPENAARVDTFRQAYGIDESVVLIGGFDGVLSDNGDRIQLQRPDSPPAEDPEFVPYLIEDDMAYEVVAPWPTAMGQSLHRDGTTTWGFDVAAWTVDAASPGSGADCLGGDFNGDGSVDLHDFIILKTHFGNNNASRETGDANGDGVVDLEDFVILKTNFGMTSN